MSAIVLNERVGEVSGTFDNDPAFLEAWHRRFPAKDKSENLREDLIRRELAEGVQDCLHQRGSSDSHIEAMVNLEQKAHRFLRGIALPSKWEPLVERFKPLVCRFLIVAAANADLDIGSRLRAWRCFCVSIAIQSAKSTPSTLEEVMEHAVAASIFAFKYDDAMLMTKVRVTDLIFIATSLLKSCGGGSVCVQKVRFVESSNLRAYSAVAASPTPFDWFKIFCERFQVVTRGAVHPSVEPMTRCAAMFLDSCAFCAGPAACPQPQHLGIAAFALSAMSVRVPTPHMFLPDPMMSTVQHDVLLNMTSVNGSDYV